MKEAGKTVPASELEKIVVAVKGNEAHVSPLDDVLAKGEFTTDPNSTPASFDFTGEFRAFAVRSKASTNSKKAN